MTRWKLSRQTFGTEVFTFFEGDEVTVGRGINNSLILSSIVVSRNHCVINVQKEKVLITDLKSSNGVYVGTKKIPQNTPYVLKDSDIIGFGWTIGAPVADIKDQEKYMFKLVRENYMPSVPDRIKFQSDTETEDEIDNISAALDNGKKIKVEKQLDKIKEINDENKPIATNQLKRKLNHNLNEQKIKIELLDKINDDVIILLSDSDTETHKKEEIPVKKLKVEPVLEEQAKDIIKEKPVKTLKENLEFEAFDVKQEYLGYDEEPIEIDSDNDSEHETWMIRLSQSSPGKPFTKVKDESNTKSHEESSYSQIDDFVDDEEEYLRDIITIPPQPQKEIVPEESTGKNLTEEPPPSEDINDDEALLNDLISICGPPVVPAPAPQSSKTTDVPSDEIDSHYHVSKELEADAAAVIEMHSDKTKRAQMIEPQIHLPKKKSASSKTYSKHHSKKKHSNSTKRHISNSQKEERKKKLKEIATKVKEETEPKSSSKNSSKQEKTIVNAKITTSNRGAFLTDVIQGVVKPTKRNESPNKAATPIKRKSDQTSSKELFEIKLPSHDIENKKKEKSKSDNKICKTKEKSDNSKNKSTQSKDKKSSQEFRVPLKSLKPLCESEESFSGKPFSKVEPLPPKNLKKKVRFSDAAPVVHEFEIEEGNKMKKTSLVKIIDSRPKPVFSLEKMTLTKILRWNPQWLEEQINNNDPPPILGNSNPPMTIFHTFNDHKQYVQLVGDLLFMEIWECLTQGYMRVRNQNKDLQMRIESLPPVPTQDRLYELFNLSVNISVPNSEVRSVPRVGEVMIIGFGPENARFRRFFFVHNVRCIPSPPTNKYSFFSISLHACYTDKMSSLRRGETILGCSLAYINNELILFEAMEYLAGSPLIDAILRPEPFHFMKSNSTSAQSVRCQISECKWTKTLNASQKQAVHASVSAALSDQPCIQMVQGPPGTGKSSVICAIVMSYFYDIQERRQKNRGKILICATSNAAVDELVIRLLNIRQKLPKTERFRMVRVGRAESMHPTARDISSQTLAQRDATARLNTEPAQPGLAEEVSHLEAKINMYKTQAQDAKDPVRVAYCQSRVADLVKRISLLRAGGGGRSGGGEEPRAEHVAETERRIIEGADIVVTTLASAHSYKMRGLKRRIALCIVDEAGQAIEPETLIPLTLDVTKLTLIGDPQQLPGFICSQRAKKHGLGESLFSRLTSCAEHWTETGPVVLLNQQYRMHAEIADYPNRAFYAGRIQTAAPPRPDLAIPPYSIISISSGDKGQEVPLEVPDPRISLMDVSDSISGANEMEAWGVARLVVALNALLHAQNITLAVITPYNAHKDLIKRNLRLLQDPAEAPVEVNTVDSFQGQERDVVVVSLARSQGVGFLTDAGRMNVMLTRARHALLVCLNPHAMLRNHQWRTLVEDAQRRNLYRVLPNKMCQPSSAGPIPNEEILNCITYHK